MSVDITTDTTAAQLLQSEHGRQRARVVRDAPLVPRFYRQITLTSGVSRNLGQVPEGASVVWINVESGNLRWRDDGNSVDAATGMLWAAGSTFALTLSNLDGINVCADASGTCVINVSFYAVYS